MAGLVEGKREGTLQKALDAAKNLLQFGLSMENITKVSELTVQQVQDL